MTRKNLQFTKAPLHNSSAAQQLKHTGLAFDYFPAFKQNHHEFHTHEYIEMLFVISGTFRHIAGERTYDETAGGLTILNFNQFHTLNAAAPVELVNVYWNPARYIPPELPQPLNDQIQKLIPLHPQFSHRLNRIIHLQMTDPEKTKNLLLMLCAEQKHKTAGTGAAIDALFRLFLIELCRAAPALKNPPEQVNRRMEKIRQHLDANYTAPIRLERLCTLARLQPANLCRQFKKYTGVSIGDYLKQYRLAAAMHQLRNSGDKILTVCSDCGFSDIANFNRTFRRAIGKTPTEYRSSCL
ncbi:MAG: AraC family transcriptional regulator [Kiritimatiellales bacterium]